MSKPFDATLNSLIDDHIVEWASFLAARAGMPMGPVQSLDTDLSTTLQPDRLFRIDGPQPFVLHLELESSGRLGIPAELLRYNTTAHTLTGLPVWSVVMLLRPKATATDLSGTHSIHLGKRPYLQFEYGVIRLPQEPMEAFLAAGPGLAPLALLTNEAAANLPAAFQRFEQRLRSDQVSGKMRQAVLGATYVLCGLRYSLEQLEEFYMSLDEILKESTTYQSILAKGEARGLAKGEAQGLAQGESRGLAQGRLDESRSLILLLGAKRFGEAPDHIRGELQSMTDPERAARIASRLLDAKDWHELLGTP
jgi:hypothetical protein